MQSGRRQTGAEKGNNLGVPKEFLRQAPQFFFVPHLWSLSPEPHQQTWWLPVGTRASAGHLNPSAHGPCTLSAPSFRSGCACVSAFLVRAPDGRLRRLETDLAASFRRIHTPVGLVSSVPELRGWGSSLLAFFLHIFSASFFFSSSSFSLSLSLSHTEIHTHTHTYIHMLGKFLNDHIRIGVFPFPSVSTPIICSFSMIPTPLKGKYISPHWEHLE